MATPGPMNPEAVIGQAKRLINTQLKLVLKSWNLPVSGAKATLQQRIISGLCGSHVELSEMAVTFHLNRVQKLTSRPPSYIEVQSLYQHNDVDGFNRLRDRIYHPESAAGHSPSPTVVRTFHNSPRQQQNTYGQPYTTGQARPMALASKDIGLSMVSSEVFMRTICLTCVQERLSLKRVHSIGSYKP